MESDLQTLFKISEVSKYWNYLSKIDLVRDTVYKKEYVIITHINKNNDVILQRVFQSYERRI